MPGRPRLERGGFAEARLAFLRVHLVPPLERVSVEVCTGHETLIPYEA
jgi:hypothetical protein